MKKRKSAVCFCLLILPFLSAGFTSCLPGGQGRLKLEAAENIVLFRSVHVIPMDRERVLKNRDVLTADGIIVYTGRPRKWDLPEGAETVDGAGGYLLPGFADMHVHAAGPEDLPLYLANGITLIRNMRGTPEHLELRERIRRGELAGPEMFTTGPIIDGAGAYWDVSLEVSDPEEVPALLEEIRSAGYDGAKVYDRLTRDVYDRILEAAGEMDFPVMGHVPVMVGLDHVISSDLLSMEHLTGFNPRHTDERLLQRAAETGIWCCPTLIVLHTLHNIERIKSERMEELKYIHPFRQILWYRRPHQVFLLEGYSRLTGELHRAGARIVAGTDAGTPFVIPGFSLHRELALLNEAGMSPWEVLRSATVLPAEMLGYSDRLGTVSRGKEADLVLLEQNPLEDTGNTETVKGVMIKGRWLDSQALQKMLDETEEAMKLPVFD